MSTIRAFLGGFLVFKIRVHRERGERERERNRETERVGLVMSRTWRVVPCLTKHKPDPCRTP